MDMKYYADSRNMSVDEYIAWLKIQIDELDFESDDIPKDVALYAKETYGLIEVTPDELARMEKAQSEEEGVGYE